MSDIADTIRHMVYEAAHVELLKVRVTGWSVFAGHVLDLAHDITKVAGAVLSNIPGSPYFAHNDRFGYGEIPF